MELLRLTTAGNVDDGKTTLMGRLVSDAKSIHRDHVANRRRDRRDGTDRALPTDWLRADRRQGKPVDAVYEYFSTPKRRFILADSPAHVHHTRSLATTGSTANAAIVVIDSRRGVVDQTRRHGALLSVLHVPHIVVCVNKMDLVNYERASYDAVVEEFTDLAAKLGLGDHVSIPMSALRGDNIVSPSPLMAWYDGPPLLDHLEHLQIKTGVHLPDARFPVQFVIRHERLGGRSVKMYGGQIASGVLRVGDDVIVLPSEATARVTGIDTADGPLDEVGPAIPVALRLAGDLDISRGDLICGPHNRPTVTHHLDATVCWMASDVPLSVGTRMRLRHTTRTVSGEVVKLADRLDIQTLRRDQNARGLGFNDIGRVRLRTDKPVFVDEYRHSRTTGSFLLVHEATGETLGVGVVVSVADPPAVVWSSSSVARSERASTGATVWITGLPASGKSTIASELERALIRAGQPCYVLDGDNLRHHLNSDLGFDRAGRTENVRRVGAVAQLFADAGLVAIAPVISPFAAGREAIREDHRSTGLVFIEVHVDTPLDVCEQRDPKGLYRRARAGELIGMTGIDDPYEAPLAPELRIDGRAPASAAAAEVLAVLHRAMSPR